MDVVIKTSNQAEVPIKDVARFPGIEGYIRASFWLSNVPRTPVDIYISHALLHNIMEDFSQNLSDERVLDTGMLTSDAAYMVMAGGRNSPM